MQFSINLSVTAVLALAAGLVSAAPSPHDTHFVVSHHAIQASGYNLTYWSEAPGSVAVRAPAPVPRSCAATDIVTCSSTHAASNAVCSELLATIRANPNVVIGSSPRAVCLGTASATECCTSWSQDVGAMLQGQLLDAATKVFNVCFAPSNTNESGLARQVALNGGCLTQCLSNRPTGCTD
ncbi:hypothetical protein MVEN_01325300 [Mycena venus]|uniref:WD-like domain-containing protein n=1 Tax=Mycena venus TaxID=2733690 RepID=A0A8H6Y106_9AGAR|nr:hypothetical protein MVEN_01325300 [Mycena venus]